MLARKTIGAVRIFAMDNTSQTLGYFRQHHKVTCATVIFVSTER